MLLINYYMQGLLNLYETEYAMEHIMKICPYASVTQQILRQCGSGGLLTVVFGLRLSAQYATRKGRM